MQKSRKKGLSIPHVNLVDNGGRYIDLACGCSLVHSKCYKEFGAQLVFVFTRVRVP